MADGRKNEDVKIIKNPLLSQNFRLEELSGVSFIVPAPKTQSVEVYGSKTGVDVPPFGEKKWGSQVGQERGGLKDVPQSSQSFTDVPLSASDFKSSNEKPNPSTQGTVPSKTESESSLLKPSISSFLPFLGFPTSLKSPDKAKEEIDPNLGRNVHQSLSYHQPLTIEPIPSESTHSSANLTSNNKILQTGLNDPLSNTIASAQTKPPEKPIPEPPKVSLPPPPSQNNSTLRNPYTLRNVHSNVSQLSKSPPSILGTSDSIPLYSQLINSNPSSNYFNFLSGPQVATTPGNSETVPVAPVIAIPSQPISLTGVEQNVQDTIPELKSFTQPQSINNEQKHYDFTPCVTNNFLSQGLSSYSQSRFPLSKPVVDDTVSNNNSSKPILPFSPSQNQILLGEKIIPLSSESHQLTFSESKPDIGIETRFPEPIVANNFTNESLERTVNSAQTTFIGSANQVLSTTATIQGTEKPNKPPTPVHDSCITQSSDSKHSESNVQAVSLNPVINALSPDSSIFQKEPLNDAHGTEHKIYSECFSELQTSTLGKSEEKNSDELLVTCNTSSSEQQKTKEDLKDSVGFQSKQVSISSIPLNNFQKIETNNAVAGNMLSVGNISVSEQTENKGLSEPPRLSGYFVDSQTNINHPTENILHLVPSAPTPSSHPVSVLQPPPSTHIQHPQSSLPSLNQQIPTETTYLPINNSNNHSLTQYNTESNAKKTFDPSALIQNSADSAKVPMLPNRQPIASMNPLFPCATETNLPLLANTSANTLHSSPSIPSNTASLYPQPVYTFPKLDSDSMNNSSSKQQPSQPFSSMVDKIEPNPVNPLIPTFNYFSSPQTSCLPPSLDQPVQKSTAATTPPSSYYFRPIQKPDVASNPYSFQSSVLTHVEPTHQVFNPTPSAPPPKTLNFPPPNVRYPKEIPSTLKQQTTNTEVSPPTLHNTDNQKSLDGEELDQIPLEGSAVPLFNPEIINRKKTVEVSAAGNTFRISGGIKKRTYAPVPDLGVTERRNFIPPSSPSCMSASSLEEMSAIHENQNQNQNSVGAPKAMTPESSLAVDNYYGNTHGTIYRPPYHHWFFKCGRDKKSPWTPFSMADSLNLEQVFTSSDLNEDTKVSTDGGRYDVELLKRKKMSVYWDEPDGEVRRCSWFLKSVSDSRYVPYDENIAALLEDEYKQGCETNEWNRKVELADGEVIILHGPSAIAHHVRSASPDAWGSQPPLQQKPRVVKRGVEDFDIPKGEPKQVDHLLLVVHGIGKACDLRFRSLVEVVDDFRSISLQLVQSHFHSGVQNGMVGRVEVLPVEWHKALHTETIDDRLGAITLPSIPRAREFTNETLLDILFYTSPVFCEKIVQAVGDELNRVYALYQKRNPGFRGQISLGAHSLGSLILFDMLCHQQPIHKPQLASAHASVNEDDEEEMNENMDELGCLRSKAKLNRRMSYLTMGPGTGQPYTIYPQLLFQPKAFFALGSPIGMFVTVRGVETLGEDFRFPTCPAFYNIFHPNDPVAYRIEALIKPDMAKVPAVLIPHHKGRKRMHLELKETMAHVTAALKQKLVDSMKNTWNAVYQLAMFNRKDHTLQGEVNKVIEDEVLREASYLESDPPIGIIGEESNGSEMRVGKLNDGRRIDYVLQEAPLETFNQYISAIRSHLVYWESEDTMLLILKEIYEQMGITPDSQVPQPILPFDISGDSETYSEYTYSIGAPPTQFVRK